MGLDIHEHKILCGLSMGEEYRSGCEQGAQSRMWERCTVQGVEGVHREQENAETKATTIEPKERCLLIQVQTLLLRGTGNTKQSP